MADINDDGAASTAKLVASDGGDARTLHLDVVDRRAVEAAADQVASELGSVDVLVNDTGAAFRCPAEDFPEDRFDYILGLNFKGHVFVLPGFRPQNAGPAPKEA